MYPISDWAILNDTKAKQLARILTKFHNLSESEITLACVLLENFHAVYRRDRLMHRQNQIVSGQSQPKKPCPPPTPTQLEEIAQRVNSKAALNLQSQEVRDKLQNLAKCLKQYSRTVKPRSRETPSWDELNHRPKFNSIQSDRTANNGYVPFLQLYSL